jgi:pantothenate kinase-related protein Tda10
MSDLAAPDRRAGVLISGVFGTGKSSTAEGIATILEARGLAYAAMDLDWLTWFHTGRDGEEERHPPLAALVACGA